jgi:acyl-CoA thioester hydrolase
MIVVNKAVAHPWFCDVIGHMTTRFYVGMFDDASYHFLFDMFGWSGAQDDKGELGWADVRHVIDYQAEVSAGDVLEVRAGLKKIGSKSMTTFYEMVNLGRDETAATLECVYVLFDLKARKAVELVGDLRAAAEKFLPGDPA